MNENRLTKEIENYFESILECKGFSRSLTFIETKTVEIIKSDILKIIKKLEDK